jgi:hypothetical protein
MRAFLLTALIISVSLVACSSGPSARKGTAIGALGGAAAGGIMGGSFGSAAVGAGIGAVGGKHYWGSEGSG